jgi:transposase
MKITMTATKTTIKKLEKIREESKKNNNAKAVQMVEVLIGFSHNIKIDILAIMYGISQESIRSWIKNFIVNGKAAFDLSSSSGRPPKIQDGLQDFLSIALEKGPDYHGYSTGCWDSSTIQDLIKRKFNISYSVKYIPELMKKMGFSYQKAKFISGKIDEKKRDTWVKITWKSIIEKAQDGKTSILFGDEASFAQWGSLSYTWAPKGQQPLVKTSGSRKGHKVFGFIDFMTGDFFHKGINEKFNSKSYQDFILDVLQKTDNHLIIIHDNARYHTSKSMRDFYELHSERMTVYQLPPYSPDLNPIEHIWKKIKKAYTHNRYFENFSDLVSQVKKGLQYFSRKKNEILSVLNFYEELSIGAR